MVCACRYESSMPVLLDDIRKLNSQRLSTSQCAFKDFARAKQLYYKTAASAADEVHAAACNLGQHHHRFINFLQWYQVADACVVDLFHLCQILRVMPIC